MFSAVTSVYLSCLEMLSEVRRTHDETIGTQILRQWKRKKFKFKTIIIIIM